ncbi:PREDICTED: transmembrane protein C5orf28 [Polistes dominula]|uniref:Transmembrane protein 267 n=1 Tax=Polistes dominula TaxID=743375 RepID=A0ABM1IUE0_POLDO|nr:PREDICTED: transmembrane protein C5orf28 [Polistes dominula]
MIAYNKWHVILKIALTSLIGICSFLGDMCLKYVENTMARAILDNLTHAIVGGLVWILILVLFKKSLAQHLCSIIFSFILSSFIDIDHFLTARSWKLSDAITLNKRPFLHCTTIPILLWVILILNSIIFNCPKLNESAWIISASFLSHHIRDGTRRGLWFCPFGSTQPIPYYIYISISMALPYILYWLMQFSILIPNIRESKMTINVV